MTGPLVGIGGIALVLSLSELLWQSQLIKTPEAARKFVHILTGTFIAFWPLIMPLWTIQIISLAMVVVVMASKYLQIFKSIHQVKRPTYGEILFPLGICLSATLARSEVIYTAAVLHLSLADGFAALIGVRYKRFRYEIMGLTKTLVGTAVFYVISLLITTGVVVFSPDAFASTGQAIVFWLPLMTTLVENIAVYGTDNLLVPVLVIGVLNSLQTVA